MTTRHAGYVVVLREDVREDDDAAILTALRMVSGVLSVEPWDVDVNLLIAEQRARHEISERVWKALRNE